jgi:predicted GNAT family N-acyltransferase
MAEPTSRSFPTASPPAGAAELTCRAAATAEERAAHFRIRHQVFVIEQGLFRGADGSEASRAGAGTSGSGAGTGRPGAGARGPGAGQDWDAHDDDPATVHVVGLADGVICGTVRLYPIAGVPGQWKGDRLAVLDGHRHQGLGAPLVRFAVATAGQRGGREMEAYIQPANVRFFQWLGWRPVGGLVTYAGIPHQRMVIGLTTQAGDRDFSRRRAGRKRQAGPGS